MQNSESRKIGGEFHTLTTLEKGQKYTVLVSSALGIGVVAIQFTLEDIKVSTYAQYPESVQLVFKAKGKRKFQGMRFHGRESCVIWQGWVEVDTNALTEPKEDSKTGFICRASKYASFDTRYMTDAIASVSTQPLFSKLN